MRWGFSFVWILPWVRGGVLDGVASVKVCCGWWSDKGKQVFCIRLGLGGIAGCWSNLAEVETWGGWYGCGLMYWFEG